MCGRRPLPATRLLLLSLPDPTAARSKRRFLRPSDQVTATAVRLPASHTVRTQGAGMDCVLATHRGRRSAAVAGRNGESEDCGAAAATPAAAVSVCGGNGVRRRLLLALHQRTKERLPHMPSRDPRRSSARSCCRRRRRLRALPSLSGADGCAPSPPFLTDFLMSRSPSPWDRTPTSKSTRFASMLVSVAFSPYHFWPLTSDHFPMTFRHSLLI